MNSTKEKEKETSTRQFLPAPTVVRGASPAAVQRARRATRDFTESLSPAPDSTAADTLALVVSELVTNALRHGGGRYTLELTAGHDALNVAVSDPSPTPPHERVPDLNREGGFGWYMVHQLAQSVTVTPGPGPGKTVRVRLPR